MAVTILDAINDEHLFGHAFPDKATWAPWFTVLRTLFGLPLEADDLARFKAHTGRSAPNPAGYTEAWFTVGRRAGKSRILATVAVYLACFRNWQPYLAAGELGHVMILARDRAQAKSIFNFVGGLIAGSPLLANLIIGETQETIELRGRVVIEIHTSSFRAVRGRTLIAGLLDEIAFWEVSEHSSNPDVEVLNALRPSLATVPGAMLLAASSPFARCGALWRTYERHFGKDESAPLVWQAPTRAMNETVPQEFIDAQLAEDGAANRAEYLAEFRSDIEGFVKLDIVKACVADGVRELPFVRGTKYFGFCDPSGGSSDSFTAAVAHREGDKVIIDCIRERRPPFSPDNVCAELAATFKMYNNITNVQSDRYAGGWPVEAFGKYGIRVEQAAKPKSELYVDLLPLINAGRIQLLDHPRLISQLVGLERRTARGGRDSIDHAPGAHDDVANAVAGAASLAIANQGVTVTPEMLQRVAAMEPNRHRSATAWGWQKRAAMAGMLIPKEQQCYPASVLPAHRFHQPTNEEGD
jgi:hypothetical protein